MSNEKSYNVTLKHTEMRELQLTLLYHLDNVLIPYYDKLTRERDYIPTQEVKQRIETLQRILERFNSLAGIFKETE